MNIRLKLIPFVVAGFLLVSSCGKNGTFPSIPQITFKSINPGEVHYSAIPAGTAGIQITMGFRSAGNMVQDSVYIQQSNDTTGFYGYPMPSGVPDQSNLQGNIVFNVLKERIVLSQNPNPNGDTVYFKVFLRDPSANKSTDTIQTAPIVIFAN